MSKKIDLATLIVDALDRRFPSDSIYKFRWTGGTAIYVNDLCYMAVRDEDKCLHFYTMGVTDPKQHDIKLNPADPEFFDKIKALTLKNLVYYENKQEEQANKS